MHVFTLASQAFPIPNGWDKGLISVLPCAVQGLIGKSSQVTAKFLAHLCFHMHCTGKRLKPRGKVVINSEMLTSDTTIVSPEAEEHHKPPYLLTKVPAGDFFGLTSGASKAKQTICLWHR